MEKGFGKTIRHEGPQQATMASRAETAEEVERHIERHFGEPSLILHEVASEYVHIDVHVIAPAPGRDFYTLITFMSDKPMVTPPGAEGLNYAELMLCLPTSWHMSSGDIVSEESWKKDWPVLWLKKLARSPHAFRTWLFWGHSMPNGDPPSPLAPDTQMCGWVLREPKLVHDEFKIMRRADGAKTWFLAAIPVYKEEMDLKLSEGTQELKRLFASAGVTELLVSKRPNAAVNR